MAKIRPISLVASISGSLCKHDGVYMATNKQTGQTYGVQVCNPFDGPATEKQKAHREEFGKKSKLAGAWIKANKPSEEQPKGSESYRMMLAAYKSQHKIGSTIGYVRTLISDDGKVMLGDIDITGTLPEGSNENDNEQGTNTPPSSFD